MAQQEANTINEGLCIKKIGIRARMGRFYRVENRHLLGRMFHPTEIEFLGTIRIPIIVRSIPT